MEADVVLPGPHGGKKHGPVLIGRTMSFQVIVVRLVVHGFEPALIRLKDLLESSKDRLKISFMFRDSFFRSGHARSITREAGNPESTPPEAQLSTKFSW